MDDSHLENGSKQVRVPDLTGLFVPIRSAVEMNETPNSQDSSNSFNLHPAQNPRPVLKILWEGCREGRKCSKDTRPESYITKCTSIQKKMKTEFRLRCRASSQQLKILQGLSPQSQDQILDLTVLHVPSCGHDCLICAELGRQRRFRFSVKEEVKTFETQLIAISALRSEPCSLNPGQVLSFFLTFYGAEAYSRFKVQWQVAPKTNTANPKPETRKPKAENPKPENRNSKPAA